MSYILLALFGTGILIPILFVVFQMIRLTSRGHSQVLLCMECDQCVKACPVLRKYPHAASPKEIMQAVKIGNLEELEAQGIVLCNSCGACEKVCPRGLAPFKQVEKMRAKSLKKKTIVEDVNVETVSVQLKS